MVNVIQRIYLTDSKAVINFDRINVNRPVWWRWIFCGNGTTFRGIPTWSWVEKRGANFDELQKTLAAERAMKLLPKASSLELVAFCRVFSQILAHRDVQLFFSIFRELENRGFFSAEETTSASVEFGIPPANGTLPAPPLSTTLAVLLDAYRVLEIKNLRLLENIELWVVKNESECETLLLAAEKARQSFCEAG